eukprot:394710_1
MDRGSIITLSVVTAVVTVVAGIAYWKRMKKDLSTVDTSDKEAPLVSSTKVSTPAVSTSSPPTKIGESAATTVTSPEADISSKPTFSWEKNYPKKQLTEPPAPTSDAAQNKVPNPYKYSDFKHPLITKARSVDLNLDWSQPS